MSELFDFVGAINTSKVDLIRTSSDQTTEEKRYPKFMVLRILSYHEDCILLVNELNIHGTAEHSVSNLQANDFLLNVIDKRKRYAPFKKSKDDDIIVFLQKYYNVSYETAKQHFTVLSETEKSEILKTLKSMK